MFFLTARWFHLIFFKPNSAALKLVALLTLLPAYLPNFYVLMFTLLFLQETSNHVYLVMEVSPKSTLNTKIS